MTTIDQRPEALAGTDAAAADSAVLRFLAAPTDVNWGGKVHGVIPQMLCDKEIAHQ